MKLKLISKPLFSKMRKSFGGKQLFNLELKKLLLRTTIMKRISLPTNSVNYKKKLKWINNNFWCIFQIKFGGKLLYSSKQRSCLQINYIIINIRVILYNKDYKEKPRLKDKDLYYIRNKTGGNQLSSSKLKI